MSNKSIVAKVSQPYAEALLESTKNTGCVNDDANIVLEALRSSKELQSSLSSPLILNESKKNIIKSVFREQLDAGFVSFLMVLVDRNRIGIVETILEKYLELAYKESAVTIANVSTAIPLSPEQHDLLTSKLKQMTSAQEVKLVITIEPELIGGFIIQIDSKVIDTSLKGQLKQMASCLESDCFLNYN
uniref:ATP synthase CF1 delta subunit n=1 Tax=Sahlingia subintegra TaxID=468936 RepID=UPI001FCD0211|nr:ATP synthase CF1 delta subunit [Sahlingia subintegra]UNJ17368.1 ATP synthase CF1 delta subunit [Sahlingia subintegra]